MGLHAHTHTGKPGHGAHGAYCVALACPQLGGLEQGPRSRGHQERLPTRGAEGLQGEGARVSTYREGPFTPDQEDE